MNKKLIVLGVFVLAFILTTSLVFAKKNSDNGSSNKSDKALKSKELKDFEKPTKEKSNAQIHKDKTEEVSDSLKNVGKEKKSQGTDTGEEVKEEITEEDEKLVEEAEEIAEEIAAASEDAAEAIEAVEKENKFKKFLIGSDYKNLGQLRSSLAHNENQIRKITKLSERTQEQNVGVDSEIQNQLVVLMQERERIKAVLQDGQEGFSILGWFGKLFGTKTEVEVDESNEEQIEEEVLEVLEDESEEEVEEVETQEETLVE